MKSSAIAFFLISFLAPLQAAEEGPPRSAPEFANLKYRPIGPFAGGRVTRVAGVPGNPLVYYFAGAASGVWKSENGGISFQPIFDDQPISSIGSIAVSASDPNVIYVGSGEANIRGNVAAGNGIYKSTDAGKTWKHVWNQIGQIGNMVVHPYDPDIAYAAVLGHAFGPNAERGVYRTRDGGKSWHRILFIDEDTGASDVCLDPNNPRILFAGTWQARRKPWDMTSGGPGGGLHTSRDGGDTWTKLGPKILKKDGKEEPNGLPEGIYGKIGVAVAASDSKRVYALIENEKGGLFRSDDGGEKWDRINPSHTLTQRIWYFGTLTIDPSNADVVWAPQVPLLRSIDGGKNFQTIKGASHSDYHDAWIDPKNPKRMIVANDGGVDISTDGGKTWYAPSLPISQFYHISCDNSVPYRVMGNMQDMGTANGPSRSMHRSGILLGDWENVGGGETGFTIADPRDPNIIYSGEYGGYLSRYDRRTRQARPIGIYPFDPSGHGAEILKVRFQWTAPILVSQHDSRVVYHGANVLFRTTNGGQTWDKISPDLTRNDKNKQKWAGGPITGDNTGVEIFCTIFALAESPKNANTLWVGSDDGLVHITRDGGKTWKNVTANIPDLPDWGTVKCIEASRYDEGTAYLVVEAHRMDDYRPHVWKTTNFGTTWKKISEAMPKDQYVHVIREDIKRKGLLFAGTERKVLVSHDDGTTWETMQLNMPTVAIHDLVVKDNDLVVGTNGRSIWILDDITPIREWKANIASQSSYLFPVSTAVRWRPASTVTGHESRVKAENPPLGAVIQYYLKEVPKNPPKLVILDAEGKKIEEFLGKKLDKKDEPEPEDDDEDKKPEVPAKPGVNRFVWNMQHPGAEKIPKAKVDMGDPTVGPMVAPGTYTANLTVDGKVLSTMIEVRVDPRLHYRDETLETLPMPREIKGKWFPIERATTTRADLISQEKFAIEVRENINRLTKGVNSIRALQKQIKIHEELFKSDDRAKDFLKAEKELAKKLTALEEKMHNPKAEIDYDILAQKGGAKLYSQLTWLLELSRDGDAPPTQGMKELFDDCDKELRVHLSELDSIRKIEFTKANELARKFDAPILWWPEKK